MAYASRGDNDSAIEFYQKTISLDSGNADAYVNIGNAYDSKGDPERAITSYLKAIAQQPTAANAFYNLSIAYVKLRSFPQARQAMQQAARLGMEDAQKFLRERRDTW